MRIGCRCALAALDAHKNPTVGAFRQKVAATLHRAVIFPGVLPIQLHACPLTRGEMERPKVSQHPTVCPERHLIAIQDIYSTIKLKSVPCLMPFSDALLCTGQGAVDVPRASTSHGCFKSCPPIPSMLAFTSIGTATGIS